MPTQPEQFENVTVIARANVYFDGKVVSHAVLFPDGSKKTLGLIYPGEFYFSTKAPEKMQITNGACQVLMDGETSPRAFQAGEEFEVPGNSGFRIAVESGICEYICSFLA